MPTALHALSTAPVPPASNTGFCQVATVLAVLPIKNISPAKLIDIQNRRTGDAPDSVAARHAMTAIATFSTGWTDRSVTICTAAGPQPSAYQPTVAAARAARPHRTGSRLAADANRAG